MLNIDDSKYLALGTPYDAKLCNYYFAGTPTLLIIQTIDQYLGRVTLHQRPIGTPVTVWLPKAGYELLPSYLESDLDTIHANFDVKYYAFIGGRADVNFVEIEAPSHPPVTIGEESKDLATIGTDQVLHLKTKDTLSYLKFGTVTWLHDLVFLVSKCGYYIQGKYYTSPAVEITLAAADATNPRIDVFYVDVNSVAAVLEGTPAAQPIEENLDPYTQLQISPVTVTAGATQPPAIEEEVIYNENVEWTSALLITKDGATVDFDNTVSPFTGAKQTRATFLPYTFGGIIFAYSNDIDVNISNSSLILSVRTSRAFTESESIYLKLADVWTVVSQPVYIKDGKYGFDSSLTTYQTLTIPFSDFKATTNLINTLRISFTGWGAGVAGNTTVDFDMIKIQKGIAPVENTETDPVFLEWLSNYKPITHGLGMDFGAREVIMGLPSTIDSTTENALTEHSHTHKLGEIKISNIIRTEMYMAYAPLYNFYCGIANLAPAGYRVSLKSDWIELIEFAGGILPIEGSGEILNIGGLLKESEFDHWDTPNEGATNYYGLSIIGSGMNYAGDVSGLKTEAPYLAFSPDDVETRFWQFSFANFTSSIGFGNDGESGVYFVSIRLVKETSDWVEGETITDIDGNVYQTVKIGNKVWTTSNFKAIHYNDGSEIQRIYNANLDTMTGGYFIYPGTEISKSLDEILNTKLDASAMIPDVDYLAPETAELTYAPISVLTDIETILDDILS